ncbi:MAG: hypothetical protein JSV65_08990 [Armatimonadota bacterium]|nr:MAG: hypothetical protein JSV65_08990 [Armatimonadota bacterium]
MKATVPPQQREVKLDAVLQVAAPAAFLLALAAAYLTGWRAESAAAFPLIVLSSDALLATALALGYAGRQAMLHTRRDVAWCILYGAWTAGAFSLVVRLINVFIPYSTRLASGRWLFAAAGILTHGGIGILLAWPYARRVLHVDAEESFAHNRACDLCLATVAVFFVVAAVSSLIAQIAQIQG